MANKQKKVVITLKDIVCKIFLFNLRLFTSDKRLSLFMFKYVGSFVSSKHCFYRRIFILSEDRLLHK